MRYIFTLSLLAALVVNSTAQTHGNLDSLKLSAVIPSGTEIYYLLDSDGCMGSSTVKVDGALIAFIISAHRCNVDFLKRQDFYKIIYNLKTYYVNRANVEAENNLFDALIDLPTDRKMKIENKARLMDTILTNKDSKSYIKFYNAVKSQGVGVMNFKVIDESDVTEGTSFSVRVTNPSTKTIKYVWVTVVGYNPVNDRVVSRGRSTFELKCVGPLKGGEDADYSFDYVWFTDLVETAKIVGLKVQYMDGSIKTIANPTSVILPRSLRNYVYLTNE